MTSKEREIYEILQTNPTISQNDLARRLNIARSSVAAHLTNLAEKGYIVGRGYLLSQPKYVAVIGAANLDIIGRSGTSLIVEDSNPGAIEMCTGGVGRNIAENLARLGTSVKVISALGDDAFGDQVIDQSSAAGVDMSHCYVKPGGRTSTYLAILDNTGEMHIALSDMALLDEMPVDYLIKKQNVIANAELIVLDAGLLEPMIEYILSNFSGTPVYLDPVSVGKAKHAKPYLGAFHTVKANRLEASFLTDIQISDEDSLRRCGEAFLEKGVRRIFISLGRQGLYYRTEKEEGICPSTPFEPVNATGAGDALMAGIVYGTLRHLPIQEIARIGNTMSRIALMSATTVSPLVSTLTLEKELENQPKSTPTKL